MSDPGGVYSADNQAGIPIPSPGYSADSGSDIGSSYGGQPIDITGQQQGIVDYGMGGHYAPSTGIFSSLITAAQNGLVGLEHLVGFNGTQNAATGSYPPPTGYNASQANPATPAASALPSWLPIAAIGGVGFLLLMMGSKRGSSGSRFRRKKKAH